MKREAIICGIITVVILIAGVCADEYQYGQPQKSKIRRAWYRGFMGYINLPIEEDVTAGWRMILEFRRRIKYLEICGAQVEHVSDDRRVFHLVNETWDGILSKGDTLRMFFTADTFPKVRGQIAIIHFYPLPPITPVTEVAVTDTSRATDQRVSQRGSTLRIDPRTELTPDSATTEGNNVSPQTANFTVSTQNTVTPSTVKSTIGQSSTSLSGDVCTQTCGSTTRITSEWDRNFGGEMTVPVTVDVRAWTVEIWFQNRVTSLQIWNARVVSSRTTASGDTVYTVSNESWNYGLDSGSNLQLSFIATIPITQAGQPFFVNLVEQPECACDLS